MNLRYRKFVSMASIGVALVGCNDAANPLLSDNLGQNETRPEIQEPQPKPAEKLELGFTEVAVTDNIPEGQEQPPDRTLTGQSTGLLRMKVEENWASIHFPTQNGKALLWTAKLTTSMGEIEFSVNPNLAPNHARNLIALSQARFYDGLQFDRTVHQISEDTPTQSFDLLKFGCPLGTGERGKGHIGYFLRPEPTETVKHEEGTVGFWHDEDPVTAGCRLYITLCAAPALDGQFTIIGKVTRGIDVLKSIAKQPVIDPQSYPEKEIPKIPTKIQSLRVTADK